MSRLFSYSHKELVEVAYKWILKRGSCGIAFKELKTATEEIPDVIGFGSGFSVVVECKTSRADFMADKKKPHRQKGMGTFRYFCCPTGLINKEELPEKWGLIYVQDDGICKVIVNPKRDRRKPDNLVYENSNEYYCAFYPNAFKRDLDAENKLLYSVIRRLFIKGFVKHIYKPDYTLPRDVDVLININKPGDQLNDGQ